MAGSHTPEPADARRGRVTNRVLTKADAESCDAVVASFPAASGTSAGSPSAKAVPSEEGLVAAIDERVAGFLTLAHHSAESAEITWRAVRADQRRRGIGRLLMEHVRTTLAERGRTFLSALTLGPSVPEDVDDGDEGTRRFYEVVGFTPRRELKLRSWDDERASLLVRLIEPPPA